MTDSRVERPNRDPTLRSIGSALARFAPSSRNSEDDPLNRVGGGFVSPHTQTAHPAAFMGYTGIDPSSDGTIWRAEGADGGTVMTFTTPTVISAGGAHFSSNFVTLDNVAPMPVSADNFIFA
jgi:hypothetical protein